MFLFQVLVTLVPYLIIIAVSVLLAILSVFVHKKYVRTPERMMKKARKNIEKENEKAAKRHRKERLEKEKQRNEQVSVNPRKQLVVGPKGKRTIAQRQAAQKRQVVTSSGLCGRETSKGTSCLQPRLRGKDHCQYHSKSPVLKAGTRRQKAGAKP